MWWLDDNLFRGTSGEKKESIQFSAQPPTLRSSRPLSPINRRPHPCLQPALTEQQTRANKRLLEAASARDIDPEDGAIAEKDAEIRILLADISSLEKVVQNQKALRLELQSTCDQRESQHGQQLESLRESCEQTQTILRRQHQVEIDRLLKKLAHAEKVCRDQAGSVSDSRVENERLRAIQLRTEKQIAERDCELDELQQRLESQRRSAADELIDAELQHAAESRYLQSIASDAEGRTRRRTETIKRLEAQLEDQLKAHVAENHAIRDVYESKLAKGNANLHEVTSRNTSLSAEVDSLRRQLQRTREESEQQLLQARRVAAERETAQLTAQQRADEQAAEVEQLRSDNDRLRTDLCRRVSEKERLAAEVESAKVTSQQQVAELAAALEQLQSENDRLRGDLSQSAAENETLVAKAAQSDLAAQQRAAEHAESLEQLRGEIGRLGDQLQKCVAEKQALVDDGATAEARRLAEVDALRDRLGCAHRQASQSREGESHQRQCANALRETVDQLQSQLDHLAHEADVRTTSNETRILELQETLQQRQQEFDSLLEQSQQTSRQLDQAHGSLERLRLKNERLIEIRDSEFTSLRSQLDEMIVTLSEEQSKRQAAENEARRLSVSRSQRITHLGQQCRQSTMQLKQLRREKNRWLEERSQLGRDLDSAEHALTDACGLLNTKTREIQQLRSELEHAEAQLLWWQQRLQREAAGWRKTEAAIKQHGESACEDSAAISARSHLQARDKIALLKGLVKSLQKTNQLQQRQSTAEILSYQNELAQLKRRLADRAA